MSSLQWFTATLSIAVAVLALFTGPVYPRRAQEIFVTTSGVVPAILAVAGLALYPAGTLPIAVVILVVIIAISAPVAGYVESVRGARGRAIGFLAPSGRPGGRFWPHLATNGLGAGATVLIVYATVQMPGFREFVREPHSAAVLVNVLIPLVAAVVMAFVRFQQATAEPNIDSRVERGKPWPDGSIGVSLQTWNQALNVVHLLLATYLSVAGSFLLLAMAVSASRSGGALPFSWWTGASIVAGLLFLLACGFTPQRSYRAVYLTFLTGTPVALGAALLLLSLLEPSRQRNLFALLLLIVVYSVYVTLVLLREYSLRVADGARDKEHLRARHYAAPAIVAFVLLAEVLALYLV